MNVYSGNISSKLVEFVKEEVDLVIMGLISLKGISKIYSIGSIVRRVAESIDCPMILIK